MVRSPEEVEARRRETHANIYIVLGCILIGAILPCVLTWFHRYGSLAINEEFRLHSNASLENFQPWNLEDLKFLVLLAVHSCGALSFFISLAVKKYLLKQFPHGGNAENLEKRSAAYGACASFANLAGYGACFLFPKKVESVFLIAVLFLVTGATCGLWIGWQIRRMRDPALGFWPRFTLRTLLGLVMGWGLLLTLFRPEMWPKGVKPLLP